jgi:phage tail sheath protein FI
MPEYLAPGVYVEEIEIGPKPIEGVSTSTAGFLGPTARGPIIPTLITSFEEYQRIFGGFLENSYLAYAVDGFFRNGGKRCFIGRITKQSKNNAVPEEKNADAASDEIVLDTSAANPIKILIRALGPGEWGNFIYYKVSEPTQQIMTQDNKKTRFKLTLYYFSSKPPPNADGSLKIDPEDLGKKNDANRRDPAAMETYDNLSIDPRSTSFYKNEVDGISFLAGFFDNIPNVPGVIVPIPDTAISTKIKPLKNGTDGIYIPNVELKQTDYDGGEVNALDPFTNDPVGLTRFGLKGMEAIEDISLLCIPDEDRFWNANKNPVRESLIDHCENLKYRFAIIQSKKTHVGNFNELMDTIRDSKYAALYFPWINVYDPLTGGERLIPSGGHIAGIYARSDTNRGVHKAPANETVRGVNSLQVSIDKGKQEILNPKGVNVIRAFPGRGIILWGARTVSKDPLWKYVNVRRLFIFIERSIDQGTQWLVFEPNNERLWSRVVATIKQFLTQVWKDGALMGTTPEEAFFVKCDRTTMTQADIDLGRLIVIIGIAPVKPAEFVIFRIAQTRSGAEVAEI